VQILGSPTPAATQDKYVDALTIEQDTADTLSFVVANASAIMRLRPFSRRGGAEMPWGPELLVSAQVSPPIKNVSAVSFRSATPGTPALVIAQLVGPEDPQVAGGTPFTGTLSASGQSSQITVVTRVAVANFPPANPSDGQVVVVVIDAAHEWYVAYNAATGYWDFLGGPPLTARIATAEVNAFGAGVWGNLPTIGPQIAVPRPGDYEVMGGCSNASAGANYISSLGVAINDTTPGGVFGDITTSAATVNHFNNGVCEAELAPTLTTDFLRLRYMTNAATTWKNRWIRAVPIRIK
jgi:hypothetical protein